MQIDEEEFDSINVQVVADEEYQSNDPVSETGESDVSQKLNRNGPNDKFICNKRQPNEFKP
jgi:hypothetical protein